MGKLLLLLLPFLIMGCEKTFDTVIDTPYANYQVTSVGPTSDFTYTLNDSTITISIVFSSSSEVNEAFCDVIASDDTKLNSSPVQLSEVSNNRFQSEFPLSTYYPNGIYIIKYYVRNIEGNLQFVGRGNFKYNNGQDNVAPMISNLQMADSISVGETIVFSVEASDSNGLNDIEYVFYEAYTPDGVKVVNSQGISEFPMFDDGQTGGDVTANDGIYSVALTFPLDAQLGNWKFVFRARDRSGVQSNIIEHFLLVQ